MKKCYFISLQAMFAITYGQVGINTSSPNATLEVASQPNDLLVIDGVIPPKLEGEILKRKDDLYGESQIGAIVYITQPVTIPSPKTNNVTTTGYYYFDGLVWQKLKNGEDVTENIYTTDKLLTSSRVIAMDDKTLSFNSNAVDGTDHFRVDEQTFNVDAVNHRVGIGTNIPKAKLDVEGDLRVRNLSQSTNASDKKLVIDNDGVLKTEINEVKGVLRAYIQNDIVTDNDIDKISILNDFIVIDNPGGEFDINTGGFTASFSGIYRLTYTVSASASSANMPEYYIFGLLDSNHQLIKKYSVLSSNFSTNNTAAGSSFSFTEIVNLVAGSTYYFGANGGLKLIANPSGSTGAGIGSYFEIDLISKK